MDPLFERRNLTKMVHIISKFLQQNMQLSILAQLKMSYEGRCSSEGFIQRDSITILSFGYPRTNFIKGGVDYEVKFQADVCLPHPGQRLKAPVTLRSKVGIHAEILPIKVLIPRDLHISQESFDKIEVGNEIEFEVVGYQFKQQDDTIIIVGKLLTKIDESPELPLLSTMAQSEAPVLSETRAPEDGEKHIVITSSAPETEKPKKRKLRRSGVGEVNEQFPSFKEGVVEGAT